MLLGHPGGPLWARKDDGAWSIPKGEIGDGEDPLAAAQREFQEETGATLDGPFFVVDPIRQRSGKIVLSWIVEADLDASALVSNTFAMEWPPRSGRRAEFPEIDRFMWFDLAEARRKILAAQVPLLDAVERFVRAQPGERG